METLNDQQYNELRERMIKKCYALLYSFGISKNRVPQIMSHLAGLWGYIAIDHFTVDDLKIVINLIENYGNKFPKTY